MHICHGDRKRGTDCCLQQAAIHVEIWPLDVGLSWLLPFHRDSHGFPVNGCEFYSSPARIRFCSFVMTISCTLGTCRSSFYLPNRSNRRTNMSTLSSILVVSRSTLFGMRNWLNIPPVWTKSHCCFFWVSWWDLFIRQQKSAQQRMEKWIKSLQQRMDRQAAGTIRCNANNKSDTNYHGERGIAHNIPYLPPSIPRRKCEGAITVHSQMAQWVSHDKISVKLLQMRKNLPRFQ